MLATLGFKLNEGVVQRLEKIEGYCNKAKGSLELVIDYLMMKRALLNPRLKLKDSKIAQNQIASFMEPEKQKRENDLADEYDLVVVDKKANDLLTLKIYEICFKVKAICKIIVRQRRGFLTEEEEGLRGHFEVRRLQSRTR